MADVSLVKLSSDEYDWSLLIIKDSIKFKLNSVLAKHC